LAFIINSTLGKPPTVLVPERICVEKERRGLVGDFDQIGRKRARREEQISEAQYANHKDTEEKDRSAAQRVQEKKEKDRIKDSKSKENQKKREGRKRSENNVVCYRGE